MRIKQEAGRGKTLLQRPARPEQGTIIKDWGGKLPIALIYPNSYFLVCQPGIHTIYRQLNSYPNIVCERVFREKENSDKKSPLLSIDRSVPERLRRPGFFDILRAGLLQCYLNP